MFTRRIAPILLAAGAALAFLPTSVSAWEWSWGGKSITGSGNVKTETREVSGFSGIGLSLPATVTVRQGSKEGLTIEADDNFLPFIETVVERGSLKIRTTERNVNFKGKGYKLNIIVDAINIDHLSIGGSGDIVADTLKSSKLKASIAGSGDMKLKSLTADSLKVSISGSGDFAGAGNVDDIEISIAGSGGVKAERLKSKTSKVSIAGSGDTALWATDTLKVSIAGSGDIRYYGDATLTKSVAGSGSIKRLGAMPN
jgi:Putative auto-transporter adhesin, head GIN domain